jgi:hypothetical protein
VETFTIHDGAYDFRITLRGKFAGISVSEVESCWKALLSRPSASRCTVDISDLTSYDSAGRKLLRRMHQHGTTFAAATPLSLVLLNEITTRPGPVLAPPPDGTTEPAQSSPKSAPKATAPPARRMAAGK